MSESELYKELGILTNDRSKWKTVNFYFSGSGTAQCFLSRTWKRARLTIRSWKRFDKDLTLSLDIKDLNWKYFYGILYVRKSYILFMKGVCLWMCRF